MTDWEMPSRWRRVLETRKVAKAQWQLLQALGWSEGDRVPRNYAEAADLIRWMKRKGCGREE